MDGVKHPAELVAKQLTIQHEEELVRLLEELANRNPFTAYDTLVVISRTNFLKESSISSKIIRKFLFHDNPIIRESAVQAIENIEQVEFIGLLEERIACERNEFLLEYMKGVAEDLRSVS